jgi:integrase
VIDGGGREKAPERSIVTAAEVWALAQTVDQWFRAMVLVAGVMGLRRGELFGLTRARVDVRAGVLTVEEQYQQLKDGRLVLGPPKTEAGRRTLAIPPSLIAELETQLAVYAAAGAHGLVFPGEKGGPLRPHVWQAKWDEACRALGLPGLHFHDLRHVANTLIAASGASTKELMHRMGHSSSSAALRYQHATRDRDAAIAATLGELIKPKVVGEQRDEDPWR